MNLRIRDRIDDLILINKDYAEESAELLNIIQSMADHRIQDIEEAYNRGLNEAWELAREVYSSSYRGGDDMKKCKDIFGGMTASHIFTHFTGFEAIRRVKEYEARLKKEEEVQSFKRGDIIQYDMGRGGIFEGIFLYEDVEAEEYWVISPASGIPQAISKNTFTLTKTGNHVEIDKNLRVIRKDQSEK